MNQETPIAVRKLHIEGDESKTFNVEIYQPKKTEDGMYRCLVHIEGAPEDLTKISFAGQDSYQALTYAIQTIPKMIDVYNKQHMNSKLRWFPNDENLYFDLDLFKKE